LYQAAALTNSSALNNRAGNTNGSLAGAFDTLQRPKQRPVQLAGTMSRAEQVVISGGCRIPARSRELIIDQAALGLSPPIVKENFSAIRRVMAERLRGWRRGVARKRRRAARVFRI
jgi:ABC-type branched-subunit amino acid transport system ATPase component